MDTEEGPANPRMEAIEEAMAHNVAQKQILSLLWHQEHQRQMERDSRLRAKRKRDAVLTHDAA